MAKKIIIGVSAGIAAYKVCSLVRMCLKSGMEVRVIMTENAAKLIAPATFQALSQNPVYVSMFNPIHANGLEHIDLAKWADVFVLAPATANTIGKIVNGIADNLLSAVVMALPRTAALIVVPAMNTNMWENPFVRENVGKLKKLENCSIVDPETGMLTDGVQGCGRMAKIETIFEQIRKIAK